MAFLLTESVYVNVNTMVHCTNSMHDASPRVSGSLAHLCHNFFRCIAKIIGRNDRQA